MPEIYTQIAERDTFEILIKNIKEFLNPVEATSATTTGRKKKKKPEEL